MDEAAQHLTPKEFTLLEIMIKQPGRVFSRGDRPIWEGIQALAEHLERTSHARFVFADLDGNMLSDSSGILTGKQINTSLSKPFAVFLIEKTPVLAYIVPLEDFDITAVENQFISSVNRSLLIAIAVAGLVGLLLIILLSQNILRPIDALTSAARALEKGDLSQRVEINSQLDVGTTVTFTSPIATS